MTNINGVGFVTVVALVAGMASVSEGQVFCPPAPPPHEIVDDDIVVDGFCNLIGVTVLGNIEVVTGGTLTLQRHNTQQDPNHPGGATGGEGGDDEDHRSTVAGNVKGEGARKFQLSHGTIVDGNFEAKDTVVSISLSGNFGDENTIGGNVKIKKSQGSILIKRINVDGNVELKENFDIITIRDSKFNNDVKIEKNDGIVTFGLIERPKTGNIVDGKVELKENKGEVNMIYNVIRDDLKGEKNTGALFVSDNTVKKVELKENKGGVTVTNNVITGDLKCEKNSDPVTVSGNTVGGKAEKQCAVP